jgi:hypothetical protein
MKHQCREVKNQLPEFGWLKNVGILHETHQKKNKEAQSAPSQKNAEVKGPLCNHDENAASHPKNKANKQK